MNENQAQWTYSVSALNEDKHSARTDTPPDAAAEMLGVDGRNTGGLNPHPGFRFVLELGLGWNSTAGLDDNGRVKGWFPITWRVSNSQYAYGFVYRVVNEAGDKARYRLVVRIGDSLTWHTEQDFNGTAFADGLLSADEDYAGEQMDVAVVGTFVYVARAGLPLFVFYLAAGSEVEGWDLNVNEAVGPGNAPILQSDNTEVGFSVGYRTPGAGSPGVHPDMAEVLTDLTAPSDADAEARVVYAGLSGLEHVSHQDNINFVTNILLSIRHADGTALDDAVNGPSDIRDEHGTLYWASPPQADPSWEPTSNTPTYEYPATYGEYAGYQWMVGSGGDTAPYGNFAHDFVWAYRLYDSRTGRFSPLSNRVRLTSDGPLGDSNGSASVVELSGGGGLANVTFPMFDIVWNSDRFDTALIYRARADDTTTDPSAVDLHLDSVVTLADYALDSQPTAPWKRAAYFTQLGDDALEVQPTFQGDDAYFVEPPRAGALQLYEGTMMFGKTATLNAEVGGLGLVYYSDLKRVSIELVPPLNRYPLRVANEEVARFCVVGSNVVGLTRSNLYLFRKFNYDLQGFPVQKGFGIPGPRCGAEVGSRVFFMTTQGVYMLTSQAELSEATAVHYIIYNEWAGKWTNVHMAYDAHMGVLVIHNPDLEHTVLLWERTNKVTELRDTVFVHAMEGQMPDDETTAGSPLLDRTVFLQEVRNGTKTAWRVYTMDYDRRKGNVRLLDPTGDVRVSVSSMALMTSVTVTGTLGARLTGCYVYVLDGNDAGEKAKIAGVTGNTLALEGAGLPVQAAGTRLGISPVLMRWIGARLGSFSPDGTGGGISGQWPPLRLGAANVVRADQVGCVFVDVDGDAATDDTNNDARFAATVFKANNTDHEGLFFPFDPKGKGVKDVSVYDGPSVYTAPLGDDKHGIAAAALHPAVTVFCPDLYYTLLEVRVVGTILATYREQRPETQSP